MEKLSKKEIIETYIQAVDIGLADIFMKMLSDEIDKRGITEFEISLIRERTFNNHYQS